MSSIARYDHTNNTMAPGGPALAGNGAPDVPGLSTAHIGPFVDFYLGGSLAKVSQNRAVAVQGGGGIRGDIKEFSKGSRKRLLHTVGKISRSALPLFITLTYPESWPDSGEVWKAHLKAFWKRIKRRYPRAACIWKLEAQKRGAPHYHLLTWGIPYESMYIISRLWYEVVGSGDDKHLKAGTNVQIVRDVKGTLLYAAKYLGKIEGQKWSKPGRFWGVLCGEFIPWAALVRVSLYEHEVSIIMRLFKRFMFKRFLDKKTGKYRKFKIRGDLPSLNCLIDCEQWFERLPEILGR